MPKSNLSGSPAMRSALNGSLAETEDSDFQISKANNQSISNHYQVPNLSSMLYEYTNNETDRVAQSFRVGNFQSLRDLPRHLLPGNVSNVSRSKIESNLYRPVEERTYVELQNGGGYFSKFAWQPDEYGGFLENSKSERLIKEAKQYAVHGDKQFVNISKKEHMYKHQNVFPSHLWGKDEE